MAFLQTMSPISFDQNQLSQFAQEWLKAENLPRASSMAFGKFCDQAVATAMAKMLGDIPIVQPGRNELIPPLANCVEYGDVRIVGGVRPQNFDVGYRPDGVRIAYDSKTLNDTDSLRKNWQNMVNDLATEATTVHTRFPHAIVAFIVIIPLPCLKAVPNTQAAIIETLERLGQRVSIDGPVHITEAVSLVAWNPQLAIVDPDVPHPDSSIRIERFHRLVEAAYVERYKGLHPHTD